MSKLYQWLDSGKYLPIFMRDFHAQKSLFRQIQSAVDHPVLSKTNWIDNHIYVIDVFLYYMARRGYTLQKTKAKQEFIELEIK